MLQPDTVGNACNCSDKTEAQDATLSQGRIMGLLFITLSAHTHFHFKVDNETSACQQAPAQSVCSSYCYLECMPGPKNSKGKVLVQDGLPNAQPECQKGDKVSSQAPFCQPSRFGSHLLLPCNGAFSRAGRVSVNISVDCLAQRRVKQIHVNTTFNLSKPDKRDPASSADRAR